MSTRAQTVLGVLFLIWLVAQIVWRLS